MKPSKLPTGTLLRSEFEQKGLKIIHAVSDTLTSEEI
jgi:hypothetical protein